MSNGTGDEFSFLSFEAGVDTLDYEKYLHSAIYLPAEIAAQLPFAVHPRLHVEGEINDYLFSGAFNPSSQGHHLILGSARHCQINRLWPALGAAKRASRSMKSYLGRSRAVIIGQSAKA